MKNGNLRRIQGKLRLLYREAKPRLREVAGVFARAGRGFSRAGAIESAAAIAYYTMFSLFPLLLAVVAFWSTVLENPQARQSVFDFVARLLPLSEEVITENIQYVRALRGSAAVLGLIGFVWSATGLFGNAARGINRAWPTAQERGFWRRRLVALVIVGVLVGLLIVSLVGTTVLHFLRRYDLLLWEDPTISQTLLGQALARVVPWLLTLLMLFGLYRWVPNTRVRGSEALCGALVAGVAAQVATAGFTWYLSSGVAGYHFVYGPLGAVAALMVWIYLSSLIVLFGAHLSAAVAQRARPDDTLLAEGEGASREIARKVGED